MRAITLTAASELAEQSRDLADKMAKAMQMEIHGVISDELRNQMRPGGIHFCPRYGL